MNQKEARNNFIQEKLESFDSEKVDNQFLTLHNEVFTQIDCLDCANCCKNYSPIILQEDIPNVLSALKISSMELFTDFIEMDEDGDFVFKSKPCPMLDLNTNKCSIYEHRPMACREYPHTNMKNILDYSDILIKNALICPAVDKILEKIELGFAE